MKAARLLNILLMLSLLATSCVPSSEEDEEVKDSLNDAFVVGEGAQSDPPAPSCFKDIYGPVKDSITRKLDILIVPDTSASIKEERKRVAEGLDYFVGALPSGVDFNVGVILGHSKNSNKSGKLYKKNSTDPLVLKSSELDLSKIKEALSLKIHKPKTDGYSDGGEMGLASLLNALEGDNLQALKENGLLRDDAALAIIFIADEQDICAKAPEGITFKKDPQNGERKSFVKYCIEEDLSWKNVTIGGDYTYKITPQIVVDKLKSIKGDMPLVVGGVLYDELSTIPTGNEDEIGYGYLETIRLANGINVDLASGDYRDGLSRLGKLATTSIEAPQSFNLSVIPEVSSIKTYVDNSLVEHSYDPLSNIVFLTNERGALSTARVEYCEKESSPLELTLGLESGIRTNEPNISLPIEVSGENFTTTVSLNGQTIFNSNLASFSVPLSLVSGLNIIGVATKNELNQEVSETIEITLNSAPIASLTANTLEGIAPLLVNFDGSGSTDDLPLSNFSLSLNGENLTSTNGLFSYTFNTPGVYPVTLTVIDSDALESTTSLDIIVKAAPIAPTANFTISKPSERAPSIVTIDASSSVDPDSEITNYALTFNGATTNQSTPIFSLNLENGGDYAFSLTVTDSQGLTNSKEGSFSLLNPLVAPVANLLVSPDSGRVPQNVALDASNSSDADGTIVKYDFYVDGALVKSNSSSTYSFNADISKSYEFKVIVTDNDGLTSEAKVSATFSPPLIAPVASLSATPLEAEVPFEVTLNAGGSTDADGEIVSYVYSDGQNVISSNSPTMTFAQEIPGTYTYSVEVIDNDGLKDVATAVVIAKPKTTTEESSLSA